MSMKLQGNRINNQSTELGQLNCEPYFPCRCPSIDDHRKCQLAPCGMFQVEDHRSAVLFLSIERRKRRRRIKVLFADNLLRPLGCTHLIPEIGLPSCDKVRRIRAENSPEEETLEGGFAGEDLAWKDEKRRGHVKALLLTHTKATAVLPTEQLANGRTILDAKVPGHFQSHIQDVVVLAHHANLRKTFHYFMEDVN